MIFVIPSLVFFIICYTTYIVIIVSTKLYKVQFQQHNNYFYKYNFSSQKGLIPSPWGVPYPCHSLELTSTAHAHSSRHYPCRYKHM